MVRARWEGGGNRRRKSLQGWGGDDEAIGDSPEVQLRLLIDCCLMRKVDACVCVVLVWWWLHLGSTDSTVGSIKEDRDIYTPWTQRTATPAPG